MSIVKERFILSGACVRYDPELLVSKRVIFFLELGATTWFSEQL